MLGWLSRWMQWRRRRRRAVLGAIRHFMTTTGQKVHRHACKAIGMDGRHFIVRVCYGKVRPYHRKWFRVGTDGQVRAELSSEEAQRFGERPRR